MACWNGFFPLLLQSNILQRLRLIFVVTSMLCMPTTSQNYTMINIRPMGSHSCRYLDTGVFLFFSFLFCSHACRGSGCSVGTRDWILICQICFQCCRSILLEQDSQVQAVRLWECIPIVMFTMSSGNGGNSGEVDTTKVSIWNPPVATQPVKPRPPPPPRQK